MDRVDIVIVTFTVGYVTVMVIESIEKIVDPATVLDIAR